MTYQLTATTETTVVVTSSATDKALELPTGSVLAASAFSETIIHRTGADGWLITRAVPSLGLPGGKYINSEKIRTLLERVEENGGTITVLRHGEK